MSLRIEFDSTKRVVDLPRDRATSTSRSLAARIASNTESSANKPDAK